MLTIGLYGIQDTTHGSAPTYTHDHGLALMRDGRVVDVIALERVTRRKHDNRLAQHIGDLLRGRITDEPIRFANVNAFVGSAFISADGNLRIEPNGPVQIDGAPVPATVGFWPDGLDARRAEGWMICHEIAHVASILPFVGRFEPRSLLVHIDGGASRSACSFWLWDGARARLLQASWDRLKVPVNNFNVGPIARIALGLGSDQHLSMPGKLMGFAGHGRPDRSLRTWLDEHRFFLETPEPAVREALRARFGEHPPFPDLAATIQEHFESTIAGAILDWQHETGAEHLYYAGGAALNIPTNAKLEASRAFRSIHVPPCTNDTGLALGAAAWIEYRERGELERHGPYLLHSSDEGPISLAEVGGIAGRIAQGEILGICNGAAEIGPRALGHRSIVARPDDPALRRRVSEVIKRREPYRPVAPMLLGAIARKAFGEHVASSALAPYMLGAWPIRPDWSAGFAGVLHADGTLRAQVVGDDDPFLVALLDRLWTGHRIAGLINTSFNGPGEPIVHTFADALACAKQIGLDGVVLNGSLHRP